MHRPGGRRGPWANPSAMANTGENTPAPLDGDVDAMYICTNPILHTAATAYRTRFRTAPSRWGRGGSSRCCLFALQDNKMSPGVCPGSWACRIDPDRLGSAHRFPPWVPLSTLPGIDTGVDFTASPPSPSAAHLQHGYQASVPWEGHKQGRGVGPAWANLPCSGGQQMPGKGTSLWVSCDLCCSGGYYVAIGSMYVCSPTGDT